MQSMRAILVLLVASAAPLAHADDASSNPLGKVLELIDELAAKVTAEGEAETKVFNEYVEWCDDAAKNSAFAIETADKEVESLSAKIGEETAAISVASTNIDNLASAIAETSTQLKEATGIREKENADFVKAEKELMEAVDALERAVKILEKEMSKGASFAQLDTSSIQRALVGLGAVLDAASFTTSDRKKLLALAQTQESAEDLEDDKMLGAPAAKNYESKSGGIVDVLEDMKDKADAELSELRKAETAAANNYAMLKQSLEAQEAADTKDMKEEKSSKSAAEESKATAEGDLAKTKEELASSKKELATAQSSCMTTAADRQTSVAARNEELKVIAEAKKILEETSAGAVSQTYSLLQLGNSADLARVEVVTMVKKLASQYHSASLAQLASKVAAEAKYGGKDVFGKIKGLISDMIAKLEAEAEEEATEKAYCDEQLAKTAAKQSELEDDVAKMTAKIDQAASKSTELKEQIKELESELATISREQADMDKIRSEQNADYKVASSDLKLGLTGVRKALQVLRDYYGGASAALVQEDQPAAPVFHSKSGGAGGSIIGILEVCESDFATGLAKTEQEEADAASEYEKMTQENKVTKATKEQDVKYKTQEDKSQEKTIAEVSGDRSAAQEELDAVNSYDAKIKDRCIAKPESYEERKARRTAEIKGLKEALSILESETALVQRKSRRAHMRGAIVAN